MNKKYIKMLLQKAYSVLTVFVLLSTNFSPLIYNFSINAQAQESVGVTQENNSDTQQEEQVTPVVPETKSEEVVTETKSETPKPEVTLEKESDVVVVDSGSGKLSNIVNNSMYVCLPDTKVSCVVTDKKDYSPTDTVVITGYGYIAGNEYVVTVVSNDPPQVRADIKVQADNNGKFTTKYTLDGNYRPNYSIEVKDINNNTVGTHTFTDSRSIDDVLVNAGTTTTVNPSDSVVLSVTVRTTGGGTNNDWNSTSYKVEGQNTVCVNHTNHTEAGTNTENINITAPSNPGSYNIDVIAYQNDGCSSGASSTYSLTDAIVVNSPLKPDLTVTKTNNVNGQTTKNTQFIWTLNVVNNGSASATFNNQVILRDDFPTSNISYADTSNLTVQTAGGVTGSIDCDINSNTLSCVDNNGDSTVVIPVNGSFTVQVGVTLSQSGTYANPRTSGVCRVDPNTVVSELNENNNNCSDTVVVSVPVTPNPSLSQSCGIDIGLVIDTSTSIDSTELSQMKSAMKSFVSAFSGTSTQMSIVSFDDSAIVRSNFTSNLSSLNSVIDGISGSGYTNWEDALLKVRSLFPNRVDKPDLIVFTSDGNPTASSAGPNDLNQPNDHLDPAIAQANAAKSAGIRIVTLGIGNDLSADNLKAISSSDAYYNSSNFSTLTSTLAQLVTDLCGGTITVKKVVNGQENPNLSNWSFNVNGGNYLTDSYGFTKSIELQNGTYSVVENIKSGYSLTSAVCLKNQQPVGSSITNGVGNISITDNDVISCTFTNTYVPVCGDSVVNGNEQCDAGSSNGIACTPTYGGSCSYCSSTCQSVTVRGPYCGDNIKNGNEECDNLDGIYNSSYKCSASCNIQLVEEKVQICHATSSNTNPYVSNSPDKSGDVSGHDGHEGPVWYPGISSSWGDIIPPFYYLGGYYEGKNWNAQGQAIWNNGCNIGTGKIIVQKTTLPTGDETSFEVYASTSNGYVFDSNLGVVSDSHDYTYLVTPGTYTITETPNSDYTTSYGDNCKDIVVRAGETQICVITNTLNPAHLTVIKDVINDNNGSKGVLDFDIRLNNNPLTFDLGVENASEKKTTYTSYNSVDTNLEYTLTEKTDVEGYTAGNWSCVDNDTKEILTQPLSLKPNQNVTCTIVNNDQPGSIIVNKEFDNVIDEVDNFVLNNELAYTSGLKWKLDSTNVYDNWGSTLTNVNAGLHSVEELNVAGFDNIGFVIGENATCNDWYGSDRKEAAVDNGIWFNVENGKTTYITFCNKLVEPMLEIFKFNNAVTDKQVGDSVAYTIQIKVSGGKVNNLFVRDSLPSGFTFVPGSSNVKLNGVDMSVSEPAYTGFADWSLNSLGVLNPDDLVTISYQATISSLVDNGLYKDIAWAKASTNPSLYQVEVLPTLAALRSVSEVEESNTIFALATGIGSLGTNFVGTEVNVVSRETAVDGVVLGEKTVQLPDTGQNILILLTSVLSIVFGVTFFLFSNKKSSKKVLSLLTILSLSMLFVLKSTTGAFAASTATLRVEDPADYVKGAFSVDYVVLDMNNNSVDVTCTLIKPDLSSVNISTNTTTAGGGAGKCGISNSYLDKGDGEYKVKVSTNTSLEDTVSVNLLTTKPETPVEYSKSPLGVCKNTIAFKTASDLGKTVKVEIFRSTLTSFTADSSTYAGAVNIASNTLGTFEDTKPNCAKTYYYAIRSVDSAGNASGFVGDTILVTLPGEVINTQNPGQGTNTNKPGEVQGEETNNQSGGNNGEVKGETNNGQSQESNKTEDKDGYWDWKTVLIWSSSLLLSIIVIWQLVKLGVFQKIFQSIWKLVVRK